MPLVATLVSNPARPALTLELAERAREIAGGRDIVWLGENVACDIALPRDAAAAETDAALRRALSGEPVDIAVQPAAGRSARNCFWPTWIRP